MTDLTGRWSGNYAYSGSLDPVSFTADLRDDGGLISGLIAEEGNGIGLSGTVHASFSGQRSGDHVSFVKIYDSHDELLDQIEYYGPITDEGHEISGAWTIQMGNLTGPFVMTRPKASTQQEELLASVTV